jgi:hypothetical protein
VDLLVLVFLVKVVLAYRDFSEAMGVVLEDTELLLRRGMALVQKETDMDLVNAETEVPKKY